WKRVKWSVSVLLINYSAIAYCSETNSTVLRLTLPDCIRMAVLHNLDIQIARYDVDISRFNLSGAYGAYEPWLNVKGTHSYAASPGAFDPQNQPFPENTSKNNYYQANITELLPTGLSFNAV